MRRPLVLIALCLAAISCGRDDPTVAEPTTEVTEAPAANGDLATRAAALESCGFTPATTEGPYYVSGTDELDGGELNFDDLPGTPMRAAGYVYASDENADPVEGAMIEIWHADDAGAYHPQDNGPADGYSDDEISLRGYVMSDEDGYYEFTSIFPGEYEGRTRHIHVRATGEGVQPLVSQIVTALEGDRFPPDRDMIASSLSECAVVDTEEVEGTRTVLFNFHLRPAK